MLVLWWNKEGGMHRQEYPPPKVVDHDEKATLIFFFKVINAYSSNVLPSFDAHQRTGNPGSFKAQILTLSLGLGLGDH